MRCDDCALAVWKRTSNGRLHPDKSGRCGWEYRDKPLASAFYWLSAQKPSGGWIERGRDIERCAYKQGGANPKKWRTE